MILHVYLKTPDALDYAVRNAIRSTEHDPNDEEYSEEHAIEELKEKCSKWFKHGEGVSLEIDTEKDTCTVVQKARA